MRVAVTFGDGLGLYLSQTFCPFLDQADIRQDSPYLTDITYELPKNDFRNSMLRMLATPSVWSPPSRRGTSSLRALSKPRRSSGETFFLQQWDKIKFSAQNMYLNSTCNLILCQKINNKFSRVSGVIWRSANQGSDSSLIN